MVKTINLNTLNYLEKQHIYKNLYRGKLRLQFLYYQRFFILLQNFKSFFIHNNKTVSCYKFVEQEIFNIIEFIEYGTPGKNFNRICGRLIFLINFYETLVVNEDYSSLEVQHIDLKHCGRSIVIKKHIQKIKKDMEKYEQEANKQNRKALRTIYQYNIFSNFGFVFLFINI